MNLRDRLQARVSVDGTTGCWEWQGARDPKGYGRISVSGSMGYAHRVAYIEFVGPIPDGLQIDHLCRNRACCNPAHLEAVTPKVNTRRGESPGAKARRREACLHGHPYSEGGFWHAGRRRCRICNAVRRRLHAQLPPEERERRKAAGLPVVDLAAYFADAAA